MALKLQATSNAGLVKQLQVCGIIKNKTVADVMKQTDRSIYCPAPNPYVDEPVPIGQGAKISAPDIHALALEALASLIRPDSMILDVGAGSGYLTTCFARLIEMKAKEKGVQPTGMVIGVDLQENLLKFAQENIKKDDQALIKKKRVIMVQGDGKIGCEEYAPYDIIYSGYAIPEAPVELLLQLKPDGHLLTPVIADDGKQYLMQYIRNDAGEVIKKVISPVLFDTILTEGQVIPNPDMQDETEMLDEDEQPLVDGEETMAGVDEGVLAAEETMVDGVPAKAGATKKMSVN